MLTPNKRVRLPIDFIEAYDIIAGDKISFAYDGQYCYRMYCSDDRPIGTEEVACKGATVDRQGYITIPVCIRKVYTDNHIFVTRSDEEGNTLFFIRFFEFSQS